MTINWKQAGTWALRLIAAILLLQTLYFKFTGAEESVYIFSRLGMEPWGRIGTGVLELLAALLILYPRSTVFGAVLAMGLMSGAIFFHLTKLGIVVREDGGQLFVYALLVFFASAALAFIYRSGILSLLRRAA